MNIVKATKRYEAWLGAALAPLSPVENDLLIKHKYMADDVYSFMRGTYYRWVQCWADAAELRDLDDVPVVLSVGDLHTDNFGSWRDVEARLVWGINDFDEASPLPYTADLVRLAASVWLAYEDGEQPMPMEEIAGHILTGYASSLRCGGAPIVLAEERGWLQDLIIPNLKDADTFWDKLTLPEVRAPQVAIDAIERSLPAPGVRYRLSERTAGVGSLGRPRYVALMNLDGAYAAREAKPLLNSAATLEWRDGAMRTSDLRLNEILDRAVRSRDPFMRAHHGWVVRRLSPDYVRVDLPSLESAKLTGQVLNAMGWETANVHAGQPDRIDAILADLDGRGRKWLAKAADRMLATVQDDFEAWSRHWRKRPD